MPKAVLRKKLKQWEPFVIIGHNIVGFDLELWIRQCYKNLIPDVYQLKKLPNKVFFIPGHPIAGTEFSGPLASKENLFNGKVQIICESKKTDSNHLNWALEWFKKIGMIKTLIGNGQVMIGN